MVRLAVYVFPLLVLAIWVWAIVDVLRVPDESMFQTGNRLIWIIIVVFTGPIGALIYWAIGRPARPRW
ncbi:MAG: PLDc N-terminal domain-containing protein [Actinobacteria bacterium]|nr:PLDc N-terminal domain-containing protein [Actinomycetota bacterium]